ncbi:unnamed protein product, partial [Urochloa humidicola]
DSLLPQETCLEAPVETDEDDQWLHRQSNNTDGNISNQFWDGTIPFSCDHAGDSDGRDNTNYETDVDSAPITVDPL